MWLKVAPVLRAVGLLYVTVGPCHISAWGFPPFPCFGKSFISARCELFYLQSIHNKGVIYQNIHNEGLSQKMERFRPVFVGKIFRTKELWVAKELKPRKPGAFLYSGSILSNARKLMGRFLVGRKWFVWCELSEFPQLCVLDSIFGIGRCQSSSIIKPSPERWGDFSRRIKKREEGDKEQATKACLKQKFVLLGSCSDRRHCLHHRSVRWSSPPWVWLNEANV